MDRTVGTSRHKQVIAPFEHYALPLVGLLTLCVLTVVFYVPVATVFVGGIWTTRFTLAPLLGILSDPFYQREIIGFTVWQAFLSTIVSLIVGLPGAWVLSRVEFRGRTVVRSLTLLPFVLPAIMVAIGFVATFGGNGTLNDALRWLDLPTVNLLYTLELVILAHAFYNAPLVIRIVAAAAERIDERMIETARSLGASPVRAFRDVVLPQLLPAVLTAALLTFIFTFMSFPIVLALGGLQLATIEVWIYARVQQLELQTAAALALIETVISLSLTYAYLRIERRQTGFGAVGGSGARRSLQAFPHLVQGGVAVYGVCVAVLFVVPIVSLIVESVTGPSGLTTRYYEFLIQRQTAGATFQVKPITAIRNSLVFAGATLVVALPMGVTVAVLTHRAKRFGRIADALLMAPLAVSGVVVGLGLLQSLVFGTTVGGTTIRVTGTLAIIAAHAVVAYPFVTRNVAPQLANINPRLVESARSLGASRLLALLTVELPLVRPGLLAGAAFAFAISIGEFDSTVLLAEGSASYTIPVAVERYLGRQTLGPATAMSTLLLFVTAASFVVIDRVGGQGRL